MDAIAFRARLVRAGSIGFTRRKDGIVFVTVHLREDVARELPQNGVQSPDTSSLLHTLAQRGVALQALHPGSTDPQLSTHFFASVESESAASELTRCLLKSPAVLAAYVKPPDAAP